jgi:hypothetical protein
VKLYIFFRCLSTFSPQNIEIVDRQTGRHQTDRQVAIQAGRNAAKKADRQEVGKKAGRQTDGRMHARTDGCSDRQTD